MEAHLFKVGHVTYGIVCRSRYVAYDYIREVMHCKDYKYLGKDTRTPKQQWESQTVGVVVPADWVSPSDKLHQWLKRDMELGLISPEMLNDL